MRNDKSESREHYVVFCVCVFVLILHFRLSFMQFQMVSNVIRNILIEFDCVRAVLRSSIAPHIDPSLSAIQSMSNACFCVQKFLNRFNSVGFSGFQYFHGICFN